MNSIMITLKGPGIKNIRAFMGELEISIDEKGDEKGQLWIDKDLYKEAKNPILDCEYKIDQLIQHEQKVILFNSWKTSKFITASNIAILLDIDKGLAKNLIGIGQICGVLIQDYNNASKVESTIMKDLLAQKVKQLQDDPMKPQPKTTEELFKEGLKESKTMDIDEDNRKIHYTEEDISEAEMGEGPGEGESVSKSVVETIPAKEGKKIQDLEKEIKRDQTKVDDKTYKGDKHILVDRINKSKVQLHELRIRAENTARSSKSGSNVVMNKLVIGHGTASEQLARQARQVLPPKKKPAPLPSVGPNRKPFKPA